MGHGLILSAACATRRRCQTEVRHSPLSSVGPRFADKKCAEPVALSSSGPADVPLSLPAAWLGFVLPALRARRSCDSKAGRRGVQDPLGAKSPQFAKSPVFHISTAVSSACGEGVESLRTTSGATARPQRGCGGIVTDSARSRLTRVTAFALRSSVGGGPGCPEASGNIVARRQHRPT